MRFYYAGCPGGHPLRIVFNKIITITAAIYHHIEMESPQSEIADFILALFYCISVAKYRSAVFTAATIRLSYINTARSPSICTTVFGLS